MSTRFVQEGILLDYANTGAAIASGAVVVLNSGATGFIGVAEDDIPATTGNGAVLVAGVVELPALGTDTGGIGTPMYWDAGNSRLTTTATSNTRAGRLAAAKTNGQTTAKLLLNAA